MNNKFTSQEIREVAEFWISIRDNRYELGDELYDTLKETAFHFGISKKGIQQTLDYLVVTFLDNARAHLIFMDQLEADLEKVGGVEK